MGEVSQLQREIAWNELQITISQGRNGPFILVLFFKTIIMQLQDTYALFVEP